MSERFSGVPPKHLLHDIGFHPPSELKPVYRCHPFAPTRAFDATSCTPDLWNGAEKRGKAWRVCVMPVICTCLVVHWQLSLFKHNWNSLLWPVVHRTIPNKYFLHARPAGRLLLCAPVQTICPATFGEAAGADLLPAAVSARCLLPLIFLVVIKPHRFVLVLRGFTSHARSSSQWSYLVPLEMRDNPENRNQLMEPLEVHQGAGINSFIRPQRISATWWEGLSAALDGRTSLDAVASAQQSGRCCTSKTTC